MILEGGAQTVRAEGRGGCGERERDGGAAEKRVAGEMRGRATNMGAAPGRP